MVKRGGGVVDIRPRIVKWDRSHYVDSADMDEYVSKHGKIDLDELVTKFDRSRVYPAGFVRFILSAPVLFTDSFCAQR